MRAWIQRNCSHCCLNNTYVNSILLDLLLNQLSYNYQTPLRANISINARNECDYVPLLFNTLSMSKYSHVPVDRQQIFCDIEITLSCNKLKTTVPCYQIGPTEYGERSVRPNSCCCRLCFTLTEKLVQIYSDTADQNMTRPLVHAY